MYVYEHASCRSISTKEKHGNDRLLFCRILSRVFLQKGLLRGIETGLFLLLLLLILLPVLQR